MFEVSPFIYASETRGGGRIWGTHGVQSTRYAEWARSSHHPPRFSHPRDQSDVHGTLSRTEKPVPLWKGSAVWRRGCICPNLALGSDSARGHLQTQTDSIPSEGQNATCCQEGQMMRSWAGLRSGEFHHRAMQFAVRVDVGLMPQIHRSEHHLVVGRAALPMQPHFRFELCRRQSSQRPQLARVCAT